VRWHAQLDDRFMTSQDDELVYPIWVQEIHQSHAGFVFCRKVSNRPGQPFDKMALMPDAPMMVPARSSTVPNCPKLSLSAPKIGRPEPTAAN
jgi:hypothetical protein